MASNLRKRTPISYYEPEEPAFDECIYCEDCSDFVYEYCSIHGPLLIVPDDKIPSESTFPSYVPRAALSIPHVFLHLAPSIIPDAGLGVFATLTLPRGVRFGPYHGRRARSVDSMYCWQIYDREHKLLHVMDAGDANNSNWMRYVNCSRHWHEQNLVAYQYQGQLYYRTIKTIPRFTELMVFYGGEFAQNLNINISKYNTDERYYETRDINTTHVVEICEVDDTTDMKYDETHSDNAASCFTDEKIELIDESNYCDINSERSDHILTTDLEFAKSLVFKSKTVTYESGNIVIKFNNDVCCLHKCEICQRGFASKKNLRRHLKIHLAVPKYACSLCNFTTNHNNTLDRHVLTHLSSFKCSVCTYETNIKNDLDQHVCSMNLKKECVVAKQRKCTFCDFATFSRKILYTHVAKHKGNILKCDLCDYSSYNKYNLLRHLRRHKF